MLIIPIPTKNHAKDTLLIIIESNDLDKMKGGSPLGIEMPDLVLKTAQMIHQPTILVCYEDEDGMKKVDGFIKSNDVVGCLKYLQRGLQQQVPLSES